jgi:hypothetical protein
VNWNRPNLQVVEEIRNGGRDVLNDDVVSISPRAVRHTNEASSRQKAVNGSRSVSGERHMSSTTLKTQSASLSSSVRAVAQRVGLAVAIVLSLLVFAVRAEAQPAPAAQLSAALVDAAHVPYGVGEELVFRATYGKLPAGTARMKVDGVEFVRGRPAYHVVFTIDGGIPFFRVHDRYESWIDVQTLSSLRHVQSISEGRYHRNTTYEIFPERGEFQKNMEEPRRSVSNPLDDGSFIYAVRAMELRVGDTIRNQRYFIPDRNPVVLTGVREDTVTVGAGTFTTTVVRPTIKTGGIFAENGDAQVWFTNDDRRLPVLVKTHFAKFSLTLSLQSVTPGSVPAFASR